MLMAKHCKLNNFNKYQAKFEWSSNESLKMFEIIAQIVANYVNRARLINYSANSKMSMSEWELFRKDYSFNSLTKLKNYKKICCKKKKTCTPTQNINNTLRVGAKKLL